MRVCASKSHRQRHEGSVIYEFCFFFIFLQVEFEDLIGEPEDPDWRSKPFIYTNSYKCFELWYILAYQICSCCCGPCYTALAAWNIANAFFNVIWCGTPCARALEMLLYLPRTFWLKFVDCCMKPLCMSSSKLFRHCSNR